MVSGSGSASTKGASARVWSIGGPMRGGLGVGAAGICMPAMCVDAVVD